MIGRLKEDGMKTVSRRNVISALATGGASLAVAELLGTKRINANEKNQAQPVIVAKAFGGQHTPKPLPFDPAKLRGLSERLVKSHWENN